MTKSSRVLCTRALIHIPLCRVIGMLFREGSCTGTIYKAALGVNFSQFLDNIFSRYIEYSSRFNSNNTFLHNRKRHSQNQETVEMNILSGNTPGTYMGYPEDIRMDNSMYIFTQRISECVHDMTYAEDIRMDSCMCTCYFFPYGSYRSSCISWHSLKILEK